MRKRILSGLTALLLLTAVLTGCAEPPANPADTANGLFGMSQSRFDELFAETLDGLFDGTTKETIFKYSVGGNLGMHFPDLLYVDGQYLAYYITYGTETGKGGVGLATSEDGIKWEKKGCVVQPSDDYDARGAFFAGVWLDTDGTFYLVYEAAGNGEGFEGNIGLATSQDGFTWEKQGLILKKDTSLSWQNINIGTPDLYKVGDTWYLTFHGFGTDGLDCQIGVATGTDIRNLTMVETPVVPTESDTAWSGTTGRRDIIKCGEYYYMVYEISTDMVNGTYDIAQWTHMFARSKDLIEWEVTEGPQLKQELSGYGNDGPNWIAVGDELYVYMRNRGNSTTMIKLERE